MTKYLTVDTESTNQDTLCARCKHPLASHYNLKHNAKKGAPLPCHRLCRLDTRCSCKGFVVAPDAELTSALAEVTK